MTHGPPSAPRRAWAGRLGLLLAGLAVGALTFLVALALRGDGPTAQAPASAAPTPVVVEPEPAPPAEDLAEPPAPPLDGLVVAVDPGHDGGNRDHPEIVTAPVPDGRGGTKPCNTVGTATASGYAEHAFTWDVSARLATHLTDLGATVVLTRPDDAGVGPCVDVRGRFGQEHDADVLVSVHANGTDDTSVRGFFAIVSDPSAHEAQGAPSLALATALVASLTDAGLVPSPGYDDAISRRSDLATLNHAEVPVVMLELGEMRNPEEAALMESAAGREDYAAAIADGLTAWAALHAP